jgi:hypothetical protein
LRRRLRSGRSALLLGALIVLAGCGPASVPATGGVAATPTLPVPMASLSPQIQNASAVIQRRLGAAGLRLEHVVQPFRTGEPAGLRLVPRALFRVMLSDPDSGWVVLYDAGTTDRASQAARDMVAYLQSGFGQTNFPMDAQFSVNQLDTTVMFTWWSRERSSDPEQAQLAFEELRRIGQPYPVAR